MAALTTVQPVRLTSGAQPLLPTSPRLLFTCPLGQHVKIQACTFSNVTATPATVTINLVSAGTTINPSGQIIGNQIVQQLTSSMANGIWGYAGTYQMSQPAPLTMTNAELSFGWVVNGLAGRKAKVLTGAGSGNTSEVPITSNTNNTITMAATGVAPVTAQSAYAIIQQPARGTGVNLLPSFGLSNIANNQGKFLYIARGGAAYGFDRLDITTDYFFMLNTHPMTETLTTGSQYAYDGGNRIYFTKEVTNRCYYLDMLTNGIHGAGMYPYTAGTALLGNRMEIFSTADNLKYLWIHRQTFTECFRQLLFY